MRYPNEATFCFVDGLELADLPDPRIGTLLAGRYVLEEVIGEGGMATVYRARQKLVDRFVAVKIMNPMLATDPVVRERFRREARSAQMLAHPNIIEIFDQGDTEDGTCFLVMELLQGSSLGALIERGPLEINRALHLMIQIARGLARAHDLEVIHRDIKPENIFLCRRDNGSDLVKLLDFGIAKSRHDSRLTGQGELFGTPQYMAPERIMGADTSGSSDLYALGVVFFEMLTGGLPFDANDITAFFAMHINEPPPSLRSRNPRVPQALDELVVKMLAKEPKDRPVDAHRIHQDLQAILHEREAPAPPDASDEPLSVPAPITLGEGPGDPWARRIFVLEQMLARAFGRKDLAPGNLTSLLDEVNELTRRVVTLRNEGFEAQNALEQIDLRGREKRAQLGFAVHQLGVDVSRAKEELRDSTEALARAEEATQASRARFLEAHKEVLYWEGRSAFVEPWSDLARAYSAAADAVEEWRLLRAEERRAQEGIENANRNVSDLDFQIRELRSALSAHERDLDEERAKCRSRIESHGKEADLLETQLYELTTRFCSPLRTRPELQGLFKELEMAAAAA
ncbi:serine/threonine protein kinase [Labilithrix luteola]|uniref:Serine/threonine protein kinase n=2 Tax=Labilithrix luteola TaxID=1391654 RepID=A0A0K1Q0Q5_9BACT|nr:serine/threonine protein kinase [Labilithrix luteola]